MELQRFEVVLIRIDFHQASGSKVRPAVVLLDTEDDDFVAAPITSRPPHAEFDLQIADWQGAGLNVSSTIRVHKLTVLAKADIARSLGVLAQGDRDSIRALLCEAFCDRLG